VRRPLIAVVVALVAASSTACGAIDSAAPQKPAAQNMRATISGYGMSIELPSGWTGRIFKRDALSAAVLRAANFPLYLGTSMALASVASDIPDGGIFIEVSDLELPMPREPWEGWSRETAPIEVRRSDFGRYEGTVAPGFALRNVVVNGRSLMIGVGFATPAPDDALLARANQLLGSLRVAADGTAWGGEDAHDAPAVWFAHRDGWFTAETSLAGPDNSPIPVAWEGNTPFLDDPAAHEFPDATVRRLPADGIAIAAVGPRPYTAEADFPTLRLPLELSDGHFVAHDYEGQPAPDVSADFIAGWLGGQALNVIVWFGTSDPTPVMRGQASDALARLSISP
jgi:hypothetical protein